jgi:hypothetical protein
LARILPECGLGRNAPLKIAPLGPICYL